jgi:hypothetical protein
MSTKDSGKLAETSLGLWGGALYAFNPWAELEPRERLGLVFIGVIGGTFTGVAAIAAKLEEMGIPHYPGVEISDDALKYTLAEFGRYETDRFISYNLTGPENAEKREEAERRMRELIAAGAPVKEIKFKE